MISATSSSSSSAGVNGGAATAAAAVPRLMIQKMVLTNFKSYAGTKEIGPFHKNFSSVVGPNGSGKSNVIDSLLFVLGRRANQIRLKKLSELIHKSSEFPHLTECRVDIHFADIIDDQSAEGFTVVHGSEFVVSRTANQECVSTYKINGKNASNNDVQTLLKGKGMDLDNNRFLILQGEVELISLMKPKATQPHEIGILEYLEDLIGTNVYVQLIEELHAKVEKLNEERQEKLQRLKLVEKEKDNLEGPKLEAEEYQKKAHEANLRRVELAQLQKAEALSNNAEFEAQKAALDKEISDLNVKLSDCTASLKTLEQEYSEKQSEHDAVAATMLKCKADFGAFERKDVKHREQLAHKKAALKKQQAKKDKAVEKVTELQQKMEADQINLPKCIKRLEKLATDKQSAEAAQTEQERQLIAISEPFKLEIESLQKSLIPLQKESNACQAAVDVTNGEISVYRDKLSSAEKKYNELKATVAKNAQELARVDAESTSNAQKLKAAQKKVKELDEEYEAVLASEVQGLKKRTQLLSALEDSKHAQASGASQGKVLQSLMAAKKKGLLGGLFGRLGDLGAIDAKYDVAVTTGCGALNMLLIDNTTTGNKAIHFLKTNNIGRAQFLALDKQNFPAEKLSAMKETPEGVPRLFDLIEFKDQRYAPAFYFACRDTLVANNLDQATRIAFGAASNGKRWRVVTLDGKVVEPAGTMSGGGAEVKKGGMPIKGSKAASASSGNDEGEPAIDIKAAEAELVKLEANLAAIKQAKKDLEKEIKEASKLVSDLETAQAKNASQTRELQTSIAEYKSRCALLEQSLSLSADELAHLKSLEARQATEASSLVTAKKAAKAVSEKVDKLQAKIMERGGGALEATKNKVTQLTTELDSLQEEVNRMQVLAETGAKKVSKLQDEVSEATNDCKVLEEEIASLLAAFKQIEDDALAVHMAFKAAEQSVSGAEAALDEIQSRFERVKKELQSLKSVEVDLHEKQLSFNKAQKEANARTLFWDKKIATLVRSINRDILLSRQEVDIDQPEEEKKEEAIEEDKRGGRASKRAVVATDNDMSDIPSFDGSYELLSPEQLATLDRRSIERNIAALEENLAQLKPNMSAIVAYLRKEKEYNGRVAILDAITLERDAARKSHEELRRKRLEEFMAGFGVITMKLKEMYQMLTLGGDAELELVDSLDPFSEGIVFSVRPPKKSWKNITNLSGGEKTLSSLALVFALHHYKPTPLYVMDEIDAALDFKNVSIVANYIKERTKNAQFIIISLRNNMFELADRLVGIYKTNNITKSITIDPKLFVAPADVKLQSNAASAHNSANALQITA